MTIESNQRRKALQLFSASSLFAVMGKDATAATCKINKESTAGPYPNVSLLNRKDLRANTSGNTALKPGALLTLRIRLVDVANGCAPIKNAVVDIWSADAKGVYSGYAAFGTQGQDFCRGYLKTDANGVVEFDTLFPGSYSGRAIHIHVAIQGSAARVSPNASGASLASVFVCQLYFNRTTVNQVFSSNPIYQQGAPITPNESDSIYLNEGGAGYLVNVTQSGSNYIGDVEIGATRAAVGNPKDDTPPVATPIANGEIVNIALATNASKLFAITLPTAKSSLSFKLSGGTGDGDLYAKLNSAPTISDYTKKSDGQTNAEVITFTNPVAGTYYLLVNAYATVSGAKLTASTT
ncbi:pre-peptidase C-terminal domain-containing protein [Undibacterium flavidum]|uniref:Pre-peptidase C-terminal domain-containing protein n=1 Tax=Undibacterium flavidum TaxID=2762297 RepID=A0ABR6Y8V0_9BURK|nr:pre-peptidase C-terminal domain-containing protein [Undibacterium flavidum]MBC3872999.1 pre-peptidase C-terminal domain-containing protein [Undibacterium flavidum]